MFQFTKKNDSRHKMALTCVSLTRKYSVSGNFFYRKSTIGTKIAAIEANNDMHCLQKRTDKFPLRREIWSDVAQFTKRMKLKTKSDDVQLAKKNDNMAVDKVWLDMSQITKSDKL